MEAPERTSGTQKDVGWLLEGLARGDSDVLAWLRARVRRRAAHRFSSWAWREIEPDFVSDLVMQLSVTVRRPGFTLRGPLEAYVDTAIANLCAGYFRRLAALRLQEPVDRHTELPDPRRAAVLEGIVVALDLRRVMAELPAEARALIVGKYVEGLSLADLAARFGTSAKTINSRLHAGRELLRSLWAGRGRPRIRTNNRGYRDSI